MKPILLILAIFGAVLLHAQEMDTTFIINEQGQTIGIIHEKGTVPVLPRTTPAMVPVASPAPQPTPQPASQYATSPYDFDSTAFYLNQIETYTRLGESKRRIGNGMMIGGGIGFAAGVVLLFSGMASMQCNEDSCEDDGVAMYLTGLLAASASEVIFVIGVVNKFVGSSKLRRANLYRQSLDLYNIRKQRSLKIGVSPIINPYNGAFGSKLALNF
ncbi:hypothetical protein [Fibrobacter sp.]|uniref:hypothetical protein n=1 Tax=Fibrobacter sp. TaxID=35828 RepID=UPI001B004B05|nr:hypothetical protein [Fibrobacter sp.]MBO7061984.1 hypothetical protein [Fibrobacter sp.]